jgi:hypothetical protein
LGKVPLAPLAGAVNVTDVFETKSPPPSFTTACSKAEKTVPTVVLCPDPPVAEMPAGAPAVTVSAKLFEVIPLNAAVMFVCPVDTAVATPPAPMLATAGALDAQVTWPVRPAIEVSLYVPVAVNGSLAP